MLAFLRGISAAILVVSMNLNPRMAQELRRLALAPQALGISPIIPETFHAARQHLSDKQKGGPLESHL